MSTTMTETSVMAHPVEVHRPGEAAQLDASFAIDLHRYDVVRVRRRGRQHERARANLNRGASLGGVPQMRGAAFGQERHGVAGAGEPAAAEDEARHLVLLGKHRAAAVDDVRVLEVDAVAGAHAEVRRCSYSNGYYSWPDEPSAAE